MPYRIRFGKHCDEVRVAVLKEVAIEVKTNTGSSSLSKTSWFATPRSWLWGPGVRSEDVHDQRQKFKQHMQEISLYKGSNETAQEPLVEIDNDTNTTVVDTERGEEVELGCEDKPKSIEYLTQIDAPTATDSNMRNASADFNTHDNDDTNEKEED